MLTEHKPIICCYKSTRNNFFFCYYYSISFCSNLFEKPQTSFVITIICKMFCIGIGNCVLHLGLGLGSVLLMCILRLMAEQLCVYKSK